MLLLRERVPLSAQFNTLSDTSVM